MLGMIGIKIQRRTIRIFRNQTCVERAFKMQNVEPDLEALDVRNYACKRTQFRDVIFTLLGGSFRFVFPTDDVDEHIETYLTAPGLISHFAATLRLSVLA